MGGRRGCVEIAEPDPAWPLVFEALAERIRGALGSRVLGLEHVGSTSVPGLPAKPVIDVDVTVADPDDEAAYVPALVEIGLALRVREPWWYSHRMLHGEIPRCHVHVFGLDSPAVARDLIFRDWLREHPEDAELYAATKRAAAASTLSLGEDAMAYNRRKQEVIRAIFARAFAARGLIDPCG